ncbi:MAG: hypothetical protein A3H42_05050 [Deltaproteobacteria bacterium RIFCSPLOWO2_02_FULL_46_8]|nr:MAG: hypothetical protein A3H42_05050 [Deltaproteobacteria bacterium RIFCSPLOWO2_02_FULL_46_8]
MAIDFKAYLPQLRELQEIDKRIRLVELELQAIPEQLTTSGAEYFALTTALQEKDNLSNNLTEERLGLETQTRDVVLQVQDREKRLYAIKTQKEYQATLKEIAQMKKENKDREERILAIMEQSEKISQEITQLKSEIADKESGFRQIETELKNRQKTLAEEKDEKGKRRPVLLKELPAEIVKKYDVVRKRFGDAVAAVRKGVCYGCNMNIPPQFYNEMLKMKDLRSCPNCHRLIYVEMEVEKTD